MKNVRIFFKKKGNLKFISHLDMNRLVIRLVNRANIKIWHTEGFNPHPYITFAVPLSLGFESEYDVMDISVLDDDADEREVYKVFKSVAPVGLEFVSSAAPIMKYADIFSADFDIIFFDAPDDFKFNLTEFLETKPITVMKKRKNGKFEEIDISKKLISYGVSEKENNICLSLRLPSGSNENVNPMLVVNAFFEKYPQYSDIALSVTRGYIYNKNGEIFK